MMKKLLLIAVIGLFSMTNMNAQTFKIGASLGIPAADAADVSNFVLGVDAYYYFTDIDDFVELGATAGFRNFFGDEINVAGQTFSIDDQQFLPIAAAARLKIFGKFSGGADIGYAVGITDGLDGGFYFRPVVGIDILDILELNASYENISDAATWGNINIGALIQL